jgi:hypothetical protein
MITIYLKQIHQYNAGGWQTLIRQRDGDAVAACCVSLSIENNVGPQSQQRSGDITPFRRSGGIILSSVEIESPQNLKVAPHPFLPVPRGPCAATRRTRTKAD